MVGIKEFITEEQIRSKLIEPNKVPILKNKEHTVFIENPELKKNLLSLLQIMLDRKIKHMPFIHISSKNLGFIENIIEKGFEARNTNVGVFIQRTRGTSEVADPNYLMKNPNDFVRDIQLFLKNYLHHGIRTNKDRLKEQKDIVKGNPVMMLIDGNCKLEKASDYDDHFILKESENKEKIIGIIGLEKNNKDYFHYDNKEDLACIIEEFIYLMKKYYGND